MEPASGSLRRSGRLVANGSIADRAGRELRVGPRRLAIGQAATNAERRVSGTRDGAALKAHAAAHERRIWVCVIDDPSWRTVQAWQAGFWVVCRGDRGFHGIPTGRHDPSAP